MPPSFRERLDQRLIRPEARFGDVLTTLEHFAIVSYLVPTDRLRPHVEPGYEIVPFVRDGETCGLVSAVPFHDRHFRFAGAPWARFSFGQTNYRLYVRDPSGDHLAWFFGTSLDTLLVAIPRQLWQLPWHRGRIDVQCDHSPEERRYRTYRMKTESEWAAAELDLSDSGEPMKLLPGFQDLDEQRLVLTHPVRGVFRRRDGLLGTYSIWHPEMQLTTGAAIHARFALFSRLGLLDDAEMTRPHSVLLTPRIEFQIALPPARL